MATAVELERLIVRLVGDSTAYLQMLKHAHTQTRQFANAMRYDFARLQAAVAVPLVMIGKATVKAFSDFDKAITESAAITNATTEQVRKMRDAALELSTKAVHGPVELGKAFYNLLSTGMDVEAAIKALPVVSEFATAGAFELGNAIDYLAGSVNALGMASDDPLAMMGAMTKVGDALVKLNNEAIGTTKDFAQALTNDAAQAMRTYNISLEDGLAVLGAYAKQQIKGEHAGSVFSRMLRLTTQAAVKNKEKFKQLGIDVFDPLTGELRAPVDIIENMGDALGKLSTEGKTAALMFLGIEARSQHAIFPLLGMSDTIRELREKLKGAGGEMRKVATKQLQAFANQMKIVWNVVTGLAIEIGGVLAPALMFLGDMVKGVIKWLQSLSPVTKQILVFTTALVGVVTVLAASYAMMAFVLGSVASAVVHVLIVIVKVGLTLAEVEERTYGVSNAWQRLGITWENIVTTGKLLGTVLLHLYHITGDLIGKALTDAATKAAEFVRANMGIVATVLGVAAAVLVVIGAYKLMVLSVTAVIGLLSTLKVLQALGIIGWMAWSAAVLTAKAVLLLFNIQFVVFKALITAAVAATTTWSVVTLIAKAVTWLWSAAMAVLFMKITITTAGVIAFTSAVLALIGTVGVVGLALVGLAYAFGLAAGAVLGVVNGVNGVLTALKAIPKNIGPIAHVSELFREWGGILKDVFEIVKTDSDTAWKLMTAGFMLAVNQIRDMWPPLWKFIQKGFDVALASIGNLMDAYIVLWTEKAKFAVAEGTGILTASGRKKFQDQIAALEKEVESIRGVSVGNITARLDKAVKDFKVVDSDDTKKAREEVEKIRKEAEKLAKEAISTAEFNKEWEEIERRMAEQRMWEEVGKKAGKGFGNGFGAEMEKFTPPARWEAVLFDSVESLIREEESMIRLFGMDWRKMPAQPPILPPAPRPPAVPAQPANPMNPVPANNPAPRRDIQSERTVELLEEIRDELRILNKKPALPVGGGLR